MELGVRGARARPQPRGAPRVDHRAAPRLPHAPARRDRVLYLRGELARYPFSLRIVFVTIAAGFALGGGLRRRRSAPARRLHALAWTQIVLDQVTWTAIVYVTGGATSGATSFYALTCLVGAILVGAARRARRRGARHRRSTRRSAPPSLRLGRRRRPIRPRRTYALDAARSSSTRSSSTRSASPSSRSSRATSPSGCASPAARSQDATARAHEAERLAVLGRIAAGLAHEIRNPLGSIRGSIEMLRESPALSDEDRRLCDIVQREARRLNDLVGDMVDLSKPRPPARRGHRRRGARARGRGARRARGARLGRAGASTTGPPARRSPRCDGAQMRQVLWNLVRNAIQASSAGSTVTVRVEPRERRGHARGRRPGPRHPGRPSRAHLRRLLHDAHARRGHRPRGREAHHRRPRAHGRHGSRWSAPPGGGASFRVTLSRDVAGLPQELGPARTDVGLEPATSHRRQPAGIAWASESPGRSPVQTSDHHAPGPCIQLARRHLIAPRPTTAMRFRHILATLSALTALARRAEPAVAEDPQAFVQHQHHQLEQLLHEPASAARDTRCTRPSTLRRLRRARRTARSASPVRSPSPRCDDLWAQATPTTQEPRSATC